MEYRQSEECKQWQFENIPAFPFGKMSALFADCGTGIGDWNEDTSDHSFMHTFFEVNGDEVREYADILLKNGFTPIYENEKDGNLFYQFTCREGLLYLSYLHETGAARVILDRCAGSDAAGFGYDEYESIREDTLFSQYSLHYDEMIKGTTCDCGMNYVMRLRDNSLVLVDGGEMEQATDIAAADFMVYLHEITNTGAGEKLRISLWLCTHAHNDHCDFLSKLIRFYGDEIQLERVAFNFPDPENIRNSPSVAMAKTRIREKYPEAEYIKLHAGMSFNIANARFDILLSAEDTVANDSEDVFQCTNATSTVFTVTADEVKTLFLADSCTENADVLTRNYSRETLTCHFLQAAHHGINEIYDTYEAIEARAVLLPQCLANMEKRFMEIYLHLCERYGKENIFFAHDGTCMFLCADGKYTLRIRPHVGTAYDGSEW